VLQADRNAKKALHGPWVLSRELALTYPQIHTFVFHGTENGGISGRMTLAPASFQAILRPPSDLARVTRCSPPRAPSI